MEFDNRIIVTKLSGIVDQEEINHLLQSITDVVVVRGNAEIVLDCSSVSDFTGRALVNLADMIKTLRGFGSALRIRNLSGHIRNRLTETVAKAILPGNLAEALVDLIRNTHQQRASRPSFSTN